MDLDTHKYLVQCEHLTQNDNDIYFGVTNCGFQVLQTQTFRNGPCKRGSSIIRAATVDASRLIPLSVQVLQ